MGGLLINYLPATIQVVCSSNLSVPKPQILAVALLSHTKSKYLKTEGQNLVKI